MDWTQVLTILVANLGTFFWLRAEANADRRQIQQEMSSDRKDFLMLIREIKEEFKEFHGRICRIEERNKK